MVLSDGQAIAAKAEAKVKVDTNIIDEIKGDIEHYEDIVKDAQEGTQSEQNMSFTRAVKLYPKAVGWSLLLSTAIVMEGFDIVLIGSFFGFPQFNRKFGKLGPDGTYTLSAPWQAGLQNGAQVGEIIGLQLNGIISSRFGYRKTMIGALALLIAWLFIPFFAQNLTQLLVGEILCGTSWGVFQTLTVAYASEVCPIPLRPFLTTYVNLCWVMGQILASGVLRGMLNVQNEWAYRIPFALQWMWPAPILIGALFAPESPYYLVRQDRVDEARKALARLTSKDDPTFDPEKTIAMIVHTNALEKSMGSGTTYWDCFKGVNLRRTEIACVVWAIQNLCGSAFMGYSTVFYERAGLATENAFDLSLAQYAIGFVGTVASWFAMRRLGRRDLYLGGLVVLCALLLLIGILGIVPQSSTVSWAVGSMLLIYTFFYDLTIGPVCYCLVAEMSSTRLRAKTIVLSRNLYNIIGIINSVLTPYMLNQTAWNWGAKTGFFWAGLCFLCAVWTYFRLPEPKGRTYGELDVLFEQRVSARNFSKTVADQYHGAGGVRGFPNEEKDVNSVEIHKDSAEKL